ncbi:hypothetical protein [Variovorax sp. OV329]|uniref:hypothetical protein n=1 Tax=Variovorax sp. OV329 TaxID=1882825 RepID=UPI0008E7C8A3|nr:hypothetical protein [Variovorax sp. OV329]SFM27300.1 hypothetical protein SAMN05444747_1043 [Variovorax sp. OV329]
MPTFFHVDRRKRLEAGQRLGLLPPASQLPVDLATHLDELFPAGLSDHGHRYFTAPGSNTPWADRVKELIWEFARRSCFPDQPSRLVSTFAWRTLEEARTFAAAQPGGVTSMPIYEVQAHDAFVANMSLLHCDSSGVRISQLVHYYWRGESGPTDLPGLGNPVWEVLLHGPVQVIGQVLPHEGCK